MGAKKDRGKKRKESLESRAANKIKTLSPNYIIENQDSLDFTELCKIYPFTESLAYILKHKVDWNILYIYNTVILDKYFFYNNEGYLDWERISAFKNLPDNALIRCPDRLNWSMICKNSIIKESTMEILYQYLDKGEIAVHQHLSEKFIEEHLKDLKCYMEEICDNQKLSEDFIRKYKDIVDWRAVSRSQKLSEAFMEEMKDYLDWSWACMCQKMTASFIEDNMDRINLYCLIIRGAYIPKSVQRTPQYEVSKLYIQKGYTIFDVENILKEEAG